MSTTIDHGDIIATETIADKIRRIAKHPSVVRNRRLLKAMHYITQRENATMTLRNSDALINNGTRKITTTTIRLNGWGTIGNFQYTELIGKPIVIFPLNSFDPHTGEPPTLNE